MKDRHGLDLQEVALKASQAENSMEQSPANRMNYDVWKALGGTCLFGGAKALME